MATSNPSRQTPADYFNSAATQYEKYTGGCTRELARQILDLSHLRTLISGDSVILDNACGPGLVAEEILQRCRALNDDASLLPSIHAVDPAPNMVDIARAKLNCGRSSAAEETVKCAVMPGEKLDYPDDTFTHSITNLGMLFYSDGPAGAREIYRTLRPGGVAAVSSWTDLGYVDRIIRPVQKAIRPDDPPYQLPISVDWLSPAYIEGVLKEGGGFERVELENGIAHYGAETLKEACELLVGSFRIVWKDWDEAEQVRFRELVLIKAGEVAETYIMVDGRQGVGIPMKAVTAVCWK